MSEQYCKRNWLGWRRRHTGPIVSVQSVDVYEDGSSKKPFRVFTRTLRSCERCGQPFSVDIEGDWTEEQVKQAEGLAKMESALR